MTYLFLFLVIAYVYYKNWDYKQDLTWMIIICLGMALIGWAIIQIILFIFGLLASYGFDLIP